MKIAIVEDELHQQELIVKYIEEWAQAGKEQVEFSCFDSSESFLFAWEDVKDYQLLVLDIEMGEINGLELAKRVRAEDRSIPIMFITGYDEYMQYGYDVSALHYLIKPVNKERLYQALDKLSESNPEAVKSLVVNGENEIRRVLINDILYVEADGHESIMHTLEGVILLKASFGEMERQLLPFKEVTKCHRAYLVNLRFVSVLQNANLILDNGEILPIARNRKKNVQQKFLEYYKSK